MNKLTIPFSTLLWRRFALFLAGIATLAMVYTNLLVSLPFWVVAALVQDWQIHTKERKD